MVMCLVFAAAESLLIQYN